MTNEIKDGFVKRILSVSKDDNAKFGKMNVNQMICHCADQFRMMFGEIEGLHRQNVDAAKLMEMTRNKQTVPSPDGMGQVEGGGTKPTELESDKNTLLNYLNRFFDADADYKFSFHPFFGDLDKVRWERLVIHHLNHHLEQFGR
jgi:hypothetical protein